MTLSIGVLLITNTEYRTALRAECNAINLVLPTFKDSWFALSHCVNIFKSTFNVSSVMFGSWQLQNKVEEKVANSFSTLQHLQADFQTV